MTTAYWRRKERLYSFIHFVDSNWDLKAVVLIQVSYDQYRATQSFRASNPELQSYKATQSFRASNPKQRYENAQNTVKHRKTP